MKLIVTIRAKKDLYRATKWYEEKQKGLGIRFANTIRHDLTFIKNNHESYQVRYKDIHTAIVSEFPYMIHYNVDNDSNLITVLSIIHTSLNPKKWK